MSSSCTHGQLGGVAAARVQLGSGGAIAVGGGQVGLGGGGDLTTGTPSSQLRQRSSRWAYNQH